MLTTTDGLRPGDRVWHDNIPSWPGVIEPDTANVWLQSRGRRDNPLVRVRWLRSSTVLPPAGWYSIKRLSRGVPCDNTEPHESHEWYDMAFRRDCPGAPREA